MRKLLSVEILRLKILTENKVSVTLIEPTKTGLEKSIMDATGSVRSYLMEKNFHNYSIQKQGQENKVSIESVLVENFKTTKSTASLYRPNTKSGDPRIWFYGLKNFAKQNDILALTAFEEKLYVLNLTQTPIEDLINSALGNPVQDLIKAINQVENIISNELLGMLQRLSLLGFIPASVNADTAVGRTLETALGIGINSSRQPDYKGIELKSYRDSRNNRKSLFAQVPEWALSKFKSSSEILNNFGYNNAEGEFKLYCTVSAKSRNPQSLTLKVDRESNCLIENSDRINIGDFVVWKLEKLHERLLEKHNETFWIAAECQTINGIEHFHYNKVEHTQKPIVTQFDILLEQGIITMDHLIKRKSNGQAVEKGPIFKIRPNGLDLLFPPSKLYKL